MALSANQKVMRYGNPSIGGDFGYYVAASEQIWGGGLVALNSSGTIQRVQTSGSLVVVGLADRDYNNTANGSASPDYVQVRRGSWYLTPAGAAANLVGQNVYATDDNTLTMSVPGQGQTAAAVAGNAEYGVSGSPFSALGISGANTGNGTFGTITPAETAASGQWLVLFSAATVFAVYKPDGTILKTAGATGTAFKDGGLNFTITAGGTAFVSGDSFIITTTPAVPLLVGTLTGYDQGNAVVKFRES